MCHISPSCSTVSLVSYTLLPQPSNMAATNRLMVSNIHRQVTNSSEIFGLGPAPSPTTRMQSEIQTPDTDLLFQRTPRSHRSRRMEERLPETPEVIDSSPQPREGTQTRLDAISCRLFQEDDRQINLPFRSQKTIQTSRLYKRTRYRKETHEKAESSWPAALELSGTKFPETVSQLTEERIGEPGPSGHLPPLQSGLGLVSPRALVNASDNVPGIKVSPFFYSDYGMNTQRTDAFSGHKRRLIRENTAFEREIQEKARRHIYACQMLGNLGYRRGCRTVEGVQGLRDTMSSSMQDIAAPKDAFPRRTGRDFAPSTRTSQYPDRSGHIAQRSPYVFPFRSKTMASYSGFSTAVRRQQTDPLPEISGRTLILGTESEM